MITQRRQFNGRAHTTLREVVVRMTLLSFVIPTLWAGGGVVRKSTYHIRIPIRSEPIMMQLGQSYSGRRGGRMSLIRPMRSSRRAGICNVDIAVGDS